MLVLTRKSNESVMIGNDIEVFVGEIVNGHVKLMFAAPDHVKILRKELWHQNRQKAQEPKGKEQSK